MDTLDKSDFIMIPEEILEGFFSKDISICRKRRLVESYQLGRQIGSGGFGAVLNAVCKTTGKQVAIKKVHKNNVPKSYTIHGKSIPAEIALLQHLKKHSNIIKLVDWFEDNNEFIIVTDWSPEYIDLFDYLTSRNPLDECCARRIFKQIVEAISYCHGRGIFHRDIKDENVLINVKTGHIKLIDFGSGAFVEDEYTDYQGTKVYSPPEWVRYQRYFGWSLESWCLGVLLFIIISGEIPFETEDDILRCSPMLKRRRISLELTDLLARCLNVDPLKRPSTKDILEHPWIKGSQTYPNPHKTPCKEINLAQCLISNKQPDTPEVVQ